MRTESRSEQSAKSHLPTMPNGKGKFLLVLVGCVLLGSILTYHYYVDSTLLQRYMQLPMRDSLAGLLQSLTKSDADVTVVQKFTDSPETNAMRFLNLLTQPSNVTLPTTLAASTSTVQTTSTTTSTTTTSSNFTTSISSGTTAVSINETLTNATNYITCAWVHGHGLGNHMFQYATLLGLAKQLNLEPMIIASEHVYIEDIFDLKIPKLNKTIAFTDVGEECVSCYTPKRYLNLQKNKSYRLSGYLQSFQYFKDIRSEVISHFAFKNKTVAEATMRKAKIVAEFCPNTNVSNCILIGVHIRRGDYLNPGKYEFGYLVADESYILRAVQWFQQHFVNFTRVFVVLGNDVVWNNNTFSRFVNDSFVALTPTSAEDDLCLLSMTNHTITTVGTFSFWAAYLAGGNVTYLKEFTRKGSTMAVIMRDQFCPTEWTGL